MSEHIDILERPLLSAALITKTIEQITIDWLGSGRIATIRDIGNGLCYEFAEEIFTRLGRRQDQIYGTGDLISVATEDFWIDDFCFDIDALHKIGEPVPKDIPEEVFATMIGAATHEWIKFEGKHYDAAAPNGVDYFLDMPFFQNQIEGLRADQKLAPKELL